MLGTNLINVIIMESKPILTA